MYRSGVVHSILRTSARPQRQKTAAAGRGKRRTSFRDDHRGNGLRSGLIDSMASINTSNGSEVECDVPNSTVKGKSRSKPIWQIARPQLQMPSATSEVVSMASVERSSSRRSLINENGMRGRTHCCISNEYPKKIVNSSFWNILVLFFTVILLFGSPIQFFLHSPAVPYFDALFFIAMLYLVIDIILTAFVDEAYFPLRWKSWKEFECGSFLFWFDVIGVGSMMYNLSFVHGAKYEPSSIEKDVSQDSEPFKLVQLRISIDAILLCTVVLRTMRIARFLNISSVVNFANNISSKVGWIFSIRNEKIKKFSFFNCCTTCASSLRTKQSRAAKLKAMRTNSQQSVVLNDTPLVSHIDNEAAAIKIQRIWRSYEDSEGLNDDSSVERPRDPNERKALRIARLKKQERRSSVRFAMSLGMISGRGDLSSRASRRKRTVSRCSEIGLAMNYITTKRVAVGIILSMILPLLFTNQERNMTQPILMVALHNNLVSWKNLNSSMIEESPETFKNDTEIFVQTAFSESSNKLLYLSFDGIVLHNDTSGRFLCCETQNVTITDNESTTIGTFDARTNRRKLGAASLCFVIFFLIIWFFGLLAFAGPITTLVVIPIERMIRLLNMLVKDPLGYENSDEFRTFVSEEDDLATNTFFTKDNLKGMETEFLMNSILRIGSLMKVGFGAAGVQIIRDSMRRRRKTISTVSCIFLFCDIRQFTDTSECLQEEIFLFTNKIAEVVHSICHSFGGFANQNKGDAFLIIWKLEASGNELNAPKREADSAMYSVVRICMALNYESFFLSDTGISEEAQTRLKDKFKDRKGNMIQIGFGLHAGRAVEGAIGSARKLDATYLSREVELAEFLESSTKKYGVSLLMSGKFYNLLHSRNQRQCRQVDEAFFPEEMDQEFDDDLIEIEEEESETFMRIYTYDFDLEVLRNQLIHPNDDDQSDLQSSVNLSEKSFRLGPGEQRFSERTSRRSIFGGPSFTKKKPFMRRLSILGMRGHAQEAVPENFAPEFGSKRAIVADQLTLPSGPTRYHPSLWKADNIMKIRQKYKFHFLFRFQLGLNAYLEGRWKEAITLLTYLAEQHNDKPSKLLLEKMASFNNIPGYKFRFKLGRV